LVRTSISTLLARLPTSKTGVTKDASCVPGWKT
jgi:hypothetical protein